METSTPLTSLSRTLLPIIVKYSKYFYSLELKEVFGAVKNGDINTINKFVKNIATYNC